jgi:ABC-type transporter Mla MlaB component
VTDAGLWEQWPRLVEGVRQRKKLLGSALEHGRPLALERGELTLGFLKGEIHSQNAAGDRATLEALLTELLQAPTRVKIVEMQAVEGAAVASLAETTDKAQREARDARLKQGREHPAVLRVMQAFGAEIEDVRDLGGAGS